MDSLASLKHFLNNFDRLIDQKRPEDAVCLVQNLLQHFPQVLLFIRYRDDPDHRPLPRVVMLQLRHRHVEVPAQLILQAAQNLPLVLQRLRVRDVQLEGEQTDRHQQLRGTAWRIYFLPAGPPPCPAASAALILVTLKHSRTSPTFTSLKLATPAPHSKPVRTSLASSLKRFKELSFDV